MSQVACSDILWELEGRLGDARAGHEPALFVLSMDLEKSFDRLHIPVLTQISERLGLDSALAALKVYQSLSRLLFIDGQPSDIVLSGSSIVGIPQGCPLACFFFCNLTSVAWHHTCSRTVPLAIHFSYLDDRLLLARSWCRLALATRHYRRLMARWAQ